MADHIIRRLQRERDGYESMAKLRLELQLEAECEVTRLRARVLKLEGERQILIDRLARIEKGKCNG